MVHWTLHQKTIFSPEYGLAAGPRLRKPFVPPAVRFSSHRTWAAVQPGLRVCVDWPVFQHVDMLRKFARHVGTPCIVNPQHSDRSFFNANSISTHTTAATVMPVSWSGCHSWIWSQQPCRSIRKTCTRSEQLIIIYNRRKFRSQTSDIWTDGKAEVGRVREEKKRSEVRKKVRKSRFSVFFEWFVALVGRKVGSLKRRVRSQLARWEMKSCTPLWRAGHFEVKIYKAPQLRSTFRSCDIEKVDARSTFSSQHVKNTTCSDHFWKLWCLKSARGCGAKHILKVKTVELLRGSGHIWTFRCRFAWQAQGIVHLVKSEKNVRVLKHFQFQPPLRSTTTTSTTTTATPTTLQAQPYPQPRLQLHYTNHIPLRYAPLHFPSWHYTTLHYPALPFPTLPYPTLHYTTATTTTTTTTALH